MKIRNIFSASILGLILGSCASEAPFEQEAQKRGEGKFLSHTLSLEVNGGQSMVRSGSDVPDVKDFTVAFIDVDDAKAEPIQYSYNEMPEVVTLSVGSYKVKAYYEAKYELNKNAGFNAPYYLGASEIFDIEKNKIVDNIDPIVCKLANIKVTVDFDQSLAEIMSDDSKVTVTVGNKEILEFKKDTNEAGYFAYVEGSNTLAATFTGVIDGEKTEETKSYSDVKPGTYYKLNFKLHTIDPNEPGIINPGEQGEEIKVDAVVNLEDYTGNGGTSTDPVEGIYLVDDRFPAEEPTIPVVPDDPISDAAPSIKAESPVDLDKVNKGSDLTSCVINVHSYSVGGITKFDCDINSNSLTPEELSGVGLASHLDLVNTDEALAESLLGLGFPVNIGGEKDVKIDISTFMPLLGALGPGQHDFVLTVEDANGTTTKTLSIQF